MHIYAGENVGETEKLVAPPVMQIRIFRPNQKTVKEALQFMMIHQIINAITHSLKLNEHPHRVESQGGSLLRIAQILVPVADKLNLVCISISTS